MLLITENLTAIIPCWYLLEVDNALMRTHDCHVFCLVISQCRQCAQRLEEENCGFCQRQIYHRKW